MTEIIKYTVCVCVERGGGTVRTGVVLPKLFYCISMLRPSWVIIYEFKAQKQVEVLQVSTYNHTKWCKHYFKIMEYMI